MPRSSTRTPPKPIRYRPGSTVMTSPSPGTYRLDRRIQRLQRRRVHPPHVLGHLARDDRAREVAVVVGAPAEGKDVDDHGRAGAELALAAEVRHGVVRRA